MLTPELGRNVRPEGGIACGICGRVRGSENSLGQHASTKHKGAGWREYDPGRTARRELLGVAPPRAPTQRPRPHKRSAPAISIATAALPQDWQSLADVYTLLRLALARDLTAGARRYFETRIAEIRVVFGDRLPDPRPTEFW